MKTELKVGDEVIVYQGIDRFKTTVMEMCKMGILATRCVGQTDLTYYHFKQCRKLIKKKSVRVTREKLSEAWVESWSHDVHVFSDFCKRIGLSE